MLNSSLLYQEEIRQNTKCIISADLEFADGTTLKLDGDRFMMGTTSFDDSTSASGTFEIGAAITQSFTTTLNNYDGFFDEYDFSNAKITPYVIKPLSNGTQEEFSKGVYYVEQPSSYGNTITITANDRMISFDKAFTNGNILYPTTLGMLALTVCERCGIVLKTINFLNSDFLIEQPIAEEGTTYRDVIASIAQAAACYARINNDGYLEFKWYDTENYNDIDGGTFNQPYSDGDRLDGGNYANPLSGDKYDGGSYFDKSAYTISAFNSFEVGTDDVVITGVRLLVDNEPTLYGTEDYCIELNNNVIFTSENVSKFAKSIGNKVIGMRFRPFSVTALADPTLEAGDVIFLEKNGNTYFSYLTHVRYTMGAWETYECTAEPPARNQANSYSSSTKAFIKAKELIDKETTAREAAVGVLAEQLASSGGMYMTQDVQPDGSVIYYMHDKPTLLESQIVWKLTANAFGISTDGGQTYPYGLDASGTAILERIYTVGLDADYINTGALTVRDEKGNVLFSADISNNKVTISALSDYASLTETQAYIDAQANEIRLEVTERTKVYTDQINGIKGGMDGAFALSFFDNQNVTIGKQDNKDVFMIGADGYLKQTVLIPAGKYELKCEIYNPKIMLQNLGVIFTAFKQNGEQDGVFYIVNASHGWNQVSQTYEFSEPMKVIFNISKECYVTNISFEGMQQAVSDAIETLKSDIIAQSDRIDAEVSRATDEEEILRGSIEVTEGKITTEVSRATQQEGLLRSSIDTLATSIVLKVDSNGKIAKVALNGDADRGTEVKIDANIIDLSADDILNLISGNSINLSSKNIAINSENFAVDEKGNLKVIGGTISGSEISGGTITGTTINGGEINGGRIYGKIAIVAGSVSTAEFASNGVEIYPKAASPAPYVDFHFNNSQRDYTARIIEGAEGALYAFNSISSASDRKLKKDIVDIDEKFIKLIDILEPKQYRFKNSGGELKLGFIAQDVDEALDKLGITDKPLVSKTILPKENTETYALAYNDLIPILWKKIQLMQKEIDELKGGKN